MSRDNGTVQLNILDKNAGVFLRNSQIPFPDINISLRIAICDVLYIIRLTPVMRIKKSEHAKSVLSDTSSLIGIYK